MAMSRQNMAFARALCFMFVWACSTRTVSSWGISSITNYFSSPDPTINCPRNIEVHADAGKRTAMVHWGPITAFDTDGRDISDRVRPMSPPPRGNIFNVGMSLLWFKVTDFNGNSKSCSFNVRVWASSCQSPRLSQHLRSNCSGPVPLGETCRFFCDRTHDLHGSPYLVCSNYGYFDDYAPECIGKPNIPPIIRCPKSITTPQEWAQKSARVTWKRPTATDAENGDISDRVELVSYTQSGTRFPVGDTPVQYRVTDREGAVDTCTFIVHVVDITCDPIPLVSHLRSDCNGQVDYGKSCQLHCDRGYALEGESTIRCTGPKTFDQTPPNCVAKRCPGLPRPKGLSGWRCSDGTNYDSTCVAHCLQGYAVVDQHRRHPSRAASTTCQANQRWTHIPVCRDIDPPVFTDCPTTIYQFTEKISNFSSVASPKVAAVDNSGVTPTISQTAGPALGSPILVGSHMVTFEASDEAGNKAECSVFINIRHRYCKAPAVFHHRLDYDCEHPLFRHGSVCSFTCRLGIEFKGSPEITCEEKDGKMYWYEPAGTPTCIEKECGIPANPPNARLSCDEAPVGKVCSVECDRGYIRARNVDQNLLICPPATGVWTNTDHPGCVLPKHPQRIYKSAMLYWLSNCSSTEDVREDTLTLKHHLSRKDFFNFCPACQVQDMKYQCQTSKGKKYLTVKWRVSAPFDPKDGYDIHSSILKAIVLRQKNWLINNFDELDIKDRSASNKRYKTRDTEVVCADEYENRGLQCAPCGDGYVFDGDQGCDRCPKDTYQDGSNTGHCSKCPVGTFTEGPGSSGCKNPCPPGSFSETGLVPCQECPLGSYQNREQSTSCVSCQSRSTTSSTGSTRNTDCYRPSEPVKNLEAVEFGQTYIGVQWTRPYKTYGALRAYDIHYHKASEADVENNTIQVTRTTVNFNITDLETDTNYLITVYPITKRGRGTPSKIFARTDPDPSASTSTVPSETTTLTPSESSSAKPKLCPPGTHSPDGTLASVGYCFPCGIGFFQHKVGQSFCFLCGPNMTTWYNGSRSKDDCVDIALEKVTTTTSSTTTTSTTPAPTTPRGDRCRKNTVSHTGFGPHCRPCGQVMIANAERTACEWCPMIEKKIVCPEVLEGFNRPPA